MSNSSSKAEAQDNDSVSTDNTNSMHHTLVGQDIKNYIKDKNIDDIPSKVLGKDIAKYINDMDAL